MIINSFLNCTELDIQLKKFNIFVGISLGNKYFSKENIKKYILWALENTKESVLVLIADQNHAVNYEVFNSYNHERTLRLAIRRGDKVELTIKKIIESLPLEKRSLIEIARWEGARESQYYKDKIKIVLDEFQENKEFHDFIIKIVQENLGSKTKNINVLKLEKLSLYVLDELPILLNGVEFQSKIYDLHPYPGLSRLDDLLMSLQSGTLFPQLAAKLEIKHKIAEVEAYVD